MGVASLEDYALRRWPLLAHGRCRKLSFGRLGASILAPWRAILTPREHPAGLWEQQDGHAGSGIRFLTLLEQFWELILEAFWVPRAKFFLCCFEFVSWTCVLLISEQKSRRWGASLKSRF